MYCKHCGCQLSESNVFCPQCGAFIETPEDDHFNFNNFSSHGVTADDLRLYVCTDDSPYYMEKWQHYMEYEHSPNPTWNWAAFLFGFLWLAYRKMYILAFLVIPINFISLLVNSSAFTALINWSICFFLALYGNKLYFLHSVRQIKKLKEKNYQGDELQAKILTNGGTSVESVFIFFIINFLCAFIIEAFL